MVIRASAIASLLLLSLTILSVAHTRQRGEVGQAAEDHQDSNLYNSASIDLDVTLTGQGGEEKIVTIPARKIVVIRDVKVATICSDKDHCSSTNIEYGKNYAIVADQQKHVWVIVKAAE